MYQQQPNLITSTRVLDAHFSTVSYVLLSKDNLTLYTCSWGKTIKIWNVLDGTLIRTLKGHKKHVFRAKQYDNEKKLATCSSDGTIKFWDIGQGTCIDTLQIGEEAITDFSFNQDHTTLWAVSEKNTITVWKLSTRQCIKTIQLEQDCMYWCELSNDQRTLSLSIGQQIRQYDTQTGEQRSEQNVFNQPQKIWHVAKNPNSNIMAFSGNKGEVTVWDISEEDALHRLQHDGPVHCCAISSDQRILVSTSEDKTFKFWAIDSGECLYSMACDDVVTSCALSSDMQMLVAGIGHTTHIWDIRKLIHRHLDVKTLPQKRVNSMFSDALDKPVLKEFLFLGGHTIETLEITANVQNLLTTGLDGINFYQINQDKIDFIKNYKKLNVTSAIPTTDGKVICICLGIRILDWLKYSTPTTIKADKYVGGESTHDTSLNCSAYIADQNMLITGVNYRYHLKVIDLKKGYTRCQLKGHTKYTKCLIVAKVNSGHTRIFSGSNDKTIKIWDYKTGQCLQTFIGHLKSIRSLAVCKEGKILISGSYDKTIKLWDIANGNCIATLTGHSQSVRFIAIMPDNFSFISASYDGIVKFWDLKSKQCLHTEFQREHGLHCGVLSDDGNRLFLGIGSHIAIYDLTNFRLNRAKKYRNIEQGAIARVATVKPSPMAVVATVHSPVDPLSIDQGETFSVFVQRIEEQSNFKPAIEKYGTLQSAIEQYSNTYATTDIEYKQLQTQIDEVIDTIEQVKRQQIRCEQEIESIHDHNVTQRLQQLEVQQTLLFEELSVNIQKKNDLDMIKANPCLVRCYNQLQLKLNAWFVGYLGHVNNISMPTQYPIIQGTMKFVDVAIDFGSKPITFALKLLSKAAKILFNIISKRKKQRQQMNLTRAGLISSADVGELVEALARKMVLTYKPQIVHLTEISAFHLGQWCAKPVIEWLYLVADEEILKGKNHTEMAQDKIVDEMLSAIQQKNVLPSTKSRIQTGSNSLYGRIKENLRKTCSLEYAINCNKGNIDVRTFLKEGLPLLGLNISMHDGKATRTQVTELTETVARQGVMIEHMQKQRSMSMLNLNNAATNSFSPSRTRSTSSPNKEGKIIHAISAFGGMPPFNTFTCQKGEELWLISQRGQNAKVQRISNGEQGELPLRFLSV